MTDRSTKSNVVNSLAFYGLIKAGSRGQPNPQHLPFDAVFVMCFQVDRTEAVALISIHSPFSEDLLEKFRSGLKRDLKLIQPLCSMTVDCHTGFELHQRATCPYGRNRNRIAIIGSACVLFTIRKGFRRSRLIATRQKRWIS